MQPNWNTSRSDTTPIQVGPHECRFGKWYDSGDGARKYQHLSVYPEIKQQHVIVHELVHQSIHILEQNWYRNTKLNDQLLDTFTQAESSSKQLTALVDKLAEEKMRYEVINNDAIADLELF